MSNYFFAGIESRNNDTIQESINDIFCCLMSWKVEKRKRLKETFFYIGTIESFHGQNCKIGDFRFDEA